MNTLRTLRVIAAWTKRDYGAARGWVRDGKLTPAACDVKTRANLYDMRDVPPSMHIDDDTHGVDA